ncbi:MAG TPA: hypothetical protein V6C89_05590 [Drouetiella sp.]|jgi:hypothetical protein
MGAKEIAAAEEIDRKAREVVKVVRKYRFHELAPHVAQLKSLIEKANKLPGANPDVDKIDTEYPFERQSAYLAGTRSKKVIAKIEEVAPEYECSCDPTKCQCVAAEETSASVPGLSCEFCDEKIALGSQMYTSFKHGEKMCPVCARILTEKVRLKESVAYAVINLVEDASTESSAPYLQFAEALKLVEESQHRLEEFRKTQRAKAGVR